MTANRDRLIGMRKQLQSRQQVVGRGCQSVLVGTTVDLFTHQLRTPPATCSAALDQVAGF